MIDPTGYLLTGIRDNAGVAALTARVRGGAPAPGDALGPGSYQRFVVLSRLGRDRARRVPIQEVRYVAKCYGVTAQDAEALAGAVSDAIHGIGPRTSPAGVVLFQSFDDGAEGAQTDPDTLQPVASIIVAVVAGTQAAPIA